VVPLSFPRKNDPKSDAEAPAEPGLSRADAARIVQIAVMKRGLCDVNQKLMSAVENIDCINTMLSANFELPDDGHRMQGEGLRDAKTRKAMHGRASKQSRIPDAHRAVTSLWTIWKNSSPIAAIAVDLRLACFPEVRHSPICCAFPQHVAFCDCFSKADDAVAFCIFVRGEIKVNR
jgi:hypothetical protein